MITHETAAPPVDVRATVRAYLAQNLRRGVSDSENIFTAGLVNSLFAVQLVTFVESAFGVTVQTDELALAHFSSVDALTDFVGRKLGPAQA